MIREKLYEHKIQYYETDQMQIVHHSNYIRWFEEARVHILEVYNMGYDKMEALGIISPVLGVQAEYKSMSRFGESVLIEVRLKEYSGVKYTLSYIIKDKATGVIRCTGETKHGFLNAQGKPLSLKRSFPEIHGIFEEMKEESDKL